MSSADMNHQPVRGDVGPCPLILRLPFDVLSIILSIVVSSFEGDFEAADEGNGQANDEVGETGQEEPKNNSATGFRKDPLLDVRSTCRTFRQIADQLPFWYVDDFNIAALPPRLFPQPSTFVEVLLADQHLQACLSRKRNWFFSDPGVFEIVAQKVPQFGENVQSLTLNSRTLCKIFNGAYAGGEKWGGLLEVSSRPLRSTPKLNNIFISLTSLEVISRDHIHLNKLPPSLRVLKLIAPDLHECSCNNSLPNLQAFTFEPYRRPQHLDFRRLLPLKSKSTLSRVHLEFGDRPNGTQYINGMKFLINFVHITDLAIHPLTSEMCKVLATSALRLKSFSTYSDSRSELHTAPLCDLLASPTLSELQIFNYEYRNWTQLKQEINHLYEPVICLLSKLTDLEEFYLSYPLSEDWFAYFEPCTKLRKVVWDYSYFPTVEVPFHFDFEDSRLCKVLRKTLRKIYPAADVEITSCYRPEYGDRRQEKEKKARELRAARKLLGGEGYSSSEEDDDEEQQQQQREEEDQTSVH